MAFSVRDFPDLLRVLREHPEWRAELRREILDDEFLQLPALVRQNSIDIAQNSADIRELKEVVARNSADIAQNSADIQELKTVVAQNSVDIAQNSADIRELRAAIAELTEQQRRNEGRLARIESILVNVRVDLGKTKGDGLESWFRNHPVTVGMGRLRRIRVVRLEDILDVEDAVDDGLITRKQAEALAHLDLLVSGREGRGDDAADALLAVETSWTIDESDLSRSIEPAGTLRVLGFNAHPAVAGREIADPVSQLASQLGVHIALRERNGSELSEATT